MLKYFSLILSLFLTIILLTFFVVDISFVGGCSSTTSQSATRVTNPPAQPSQSYIPSFEENISELALIPTEESSNLIAQANLRRSLQSLISPTLDWTELVLDENSPIGSLRTARESLELMGDAVFAQLEELEEDYDVTDGVVVLLDEQTTLIDKLARWRVEMDVIEEFYVRQIFYNPEDDKIWGYYISAMDSNGNPLKGHFAYIDRDNQDATAGTGFVYFALTFDFESLEKNIVTRSIYFDPNFSHATTFHSHYLCEEESSSCNLEFIEINEEPDNSQSTRNFSSRSMRTTYNNTTFEICTAPLEFSESSVTLGTSQKFIGPNQPTDAEVTLDDCTPQTALSSSHVYVDGDLPIRIGDSAEETTISSILRESEIEGESIEGWEDHVKTENIES